MPLIVYKDQLLDSLSNIINIIGVRLILLVELALSSNVGLSNVFISSSNKFELLQATNESLQNAKKYSVC